jgi:hypothetical protein
MGLLDLPAPALSWADTALAALLPGPARLVLWGAIAAAMSMGLYRLLSPQRRLAAIVTVERRLKRTMRDDAIDPAIGLALARRLLRLAALRLALSLLPALAAALPVVSLMVWLETRYARDLPPPGQSAAVRVEPANHAQGRWIGSESEPPRVDILDADGAPLLSLAVTAPVMVVHKWLWWNALVGNPLGYLPPDAPLDRVEIELPPVRYLPGLPEALQGWEAVFIVTMLAASLALKFAFRIR